LDRSVAFAEDQPFANQITQAAAIQEERGYAWRMHIACWFAKQALKQDGDFVVCGDAHGFAALVLCRQLDFQHHACRLWLLDTRFQAANVAAPSALQSGMSTPSAGAGYAYVKARFQAYPNVHIQEGALPDIWAADAPRVIAFLYLQVRPMDTARAALAHIFPLLAPGAIIVLDDFGQLANRAQAQDLQDFLAGNKLTVLELPTGQGIVTLSGQSGAGIAA